MCRCRLSSSVCIIFKSWLQLGQQTLCVFLDLHVSYNTSAVQTYVHQGGVDVVAALSVYGDEEGQASVGRKAVHEAVLVLVPRQQRDAAVFGLRLRGHRVQRLDEQRRTEALGGGACFRGCVWL